MELVREDMGFEPEAAWCEAQTLPLCYMTPRVSLTYLFKRPCLVLAANKNINCTVLLFYDALNKVGFVCLALM